MEIFEEDGDLDVRYAIGHQTLNDEANEGDSSEKDQELECIELSETTYLEDDIESREVDDDGDSNALKEKNDSRTEQTSYCRRALVYKTIPFALTLMATILTGFGSWSCDYFHGANIDFLGSTYGIWTVEDISGKCQLWDTLFFSYHLDNSLVAARALSMSAMILGLEMLTTLSLATQSAVATWGIGFAFGVLLCLSVSFRQTFNLWMTFWLLTYVIMVMITRALFIHPVHLRISRRMRICIATCMILCMTFTTTTLVVLSSKYCTCHTLTHTDLEDRIMGDPCSGSCRLSVGGYIMMLSSCLWFLAAIAVLKIGIQPEEIHVKDSTAADAMFGRYSNTRRVMHVSSSHDSSDAKTNTDGTRCRLWQRICCDYRVTSRSRTEACLFWLFRATLSIIVAMYIFVLIVLVGSRIQNDNAALAPSTTSNFILDPVCGFNADNPTEPFLTFATADDARKAHMTIAHCGPCGYCSNMQDIETYVSTRKTVAQSAKQCGKVAVLGSHDGLVDCLEEKIQFSTQCTMCWADNMESTTKHCLVTCLKTMFTGFMASNNIADAGISGWLNQCLQCDEKMSGTQFVTCSGVARRRLGISSEIERNPQEQCSSVGVDWLSHFAL